MLNLPNVIIEKVETMRDGGLKLKLVTRELSPEQKVALMDIVNVESDALGLDLEGGIDDTKSPSQRLRGVLYKLWETEYKNKFKTFQLFYSHTMEIICNHYKDKIS